jgi:hypothetical protein
MRSVIGVVAMVPAASTAHAQPQGQAPRSLPARMLLRVALVAVAASLAASCGSRPERSEPGLLIVAEPSEQNLDPDPRAPPDDDHGTGTGTFAVEPVLCAYGESGVRSDQRGMRAPGWVVLVVDVEAPEIVGGVEVASLELLDHVTGEVVSATTPVDVRVMSPNRSLDDLSLLGTEPFSGQLAPQTRLRLRVQANLEERQAPLRDQLPGRTSLCTPEGNCYGYARSGCCHAADWDACSLWPSATPGAIGQ